MRKYREYTKQNIIDVSKKVKSLRSLLIELGLKPAGGNYANMKRLLQSLKVDTSHWTGKGWNKGERLKDWSKYTKSKSLKEHLIKERGRECESCKLKEWRGELIPLELHHIDGDRTNNDKKNLKLECCNCHALTPNWRNRKTDKQKKEYKARSKKIVRECFTCGSPCVNKYCSKLCYSRAAAARRRKRMNKCLECGGEAINKYCSYECSSKAKRKVDKPSVNELKDLVWAYPTVKVAKIFGVSDTMVSKWCKRDGVEKPPRGYWRQLECGKVAQPLDET